MSSGPDLARPLVDSDLLGTSETRAQRIMAELAALAADRDNVVSASSLEHLSAMGRVEPVKLTPEKPPADTTQAAASKGGERVSADAARRQRVEELTRFFMEAKSDIEFALSGGLGRRERARQDQHVDPDAKSDEEKSDESMLEGADDARDGAESSTPPAPSPPSPAPSLDRVHFKMLSEPVDARVFHPLLASIRDSDPLLYGTIVCHPLVAVHDPKHRAKAVAAKTTKKKKHKPDVPSMYTPDFTAPALSPDEARVHVGRFVARAVADGTIPALLMAAHVVLSYDATAPYALASHLQVLGGAPAPGEGPKPPASTAAPPLAPSPDVVLDTADFMSSVMELEGAMGPLAALRTRLGRLDDASMDDDAMDGPSSQLPLDEGVDEEALMARAIALSLSPELQLQEADAAPPALGDSVNAIPAPFSTDELVGLATFHLPSPVTVESLDVPGAVVVQHLWAGVHTIVRDYVALASRKALVPLSNPIVPNPLVLLLLTSLLARVRHAAGDGRRDDFVFASGALVLLHALDAYLFHVHVMGTAPASVGLGHSLSHPNPLPLAIKAITLHYAHDTPQAASEDELPIDAAVFTDPTASLANVVAAYRRRLPAQARVTWARGLGHFYPQHADRHALLHSLLGKPLSPARQAELDLVCTRLALPDLARGFVPVVPDATGVDAALVDDSTLLGAKHCAWPPALVRASLEAKTCHVGSVVELLSAVAPAIVDSTTHAHSVDMVLSLYTQAFEGQVEAVKQTWADLLPTMDRLSAHVDAPTPDTTVALPTPAFASVVGPPRRMLLRALQDGLVASVHGSLVGDEPTRLEFDAARCADTLTLVDHAASAKQHTAKQWGMVLSTYGCAPNTGLHEWAVRLDRCEKGHVFLGVCTREASVATYVGGDRHGWGLIGTRALWHNRSKVRGDYGDGFSTGSVVRIRLNTDSGALSFGLLDDDSDWGVAFDGLTQHGTLYPAIGLYQRDDQVSIVPVASSVPIPPALGPADHAAPPLYHDVVLASFFQYVASVAQASDALLVDLGLPLFSTLALLARQASTRAHPVATMFAIKLLPVCLQVLERLDEPSSTDDGAATTRQPRLALAVHGKWELKSMAAGTIPAQQYLLDLTQADDGAVRGQSASSSVAVDGVVRGTRLSFVETWTQGGTCLVQGRLRVDGRAFTGTYEDTKSHTVGSISGTALSSASSIQDPRLVLQMVVGTLVGAYNTTLLTSDPEHPVSSGYADALVDAASAPPSPEATAEEYEEWIASPLFAGGLPELVPHVAALAQRYAVAPSRWGSAVVPTVAAASVDVPGLLADLIAGRNDLDAHVTKHLGESPILRLGGDAMKTARRLVCACMLWHTGIAVDVQADPSVRPHENVLHIWRAAQRVVEWSVRMKQTHAQSYQDLAAYLSRRARFLLQLENPLAATCPTSDRVLSETLMSLSRFLQATGLQLGKLHQLLLRNAGRAYFRALGLQSTRFVLEMGLVRSSSALCHVLQWLHADPLADKAGVAHHYGHGIDGCGRSLAGLVKDAWEALYAHLASTLSRSTWAKDTDLQLVVLQAWGVLITPDDHAFVSRVGIFRILQTVLDEARSSPVVPKHIVQAALKVVHLLAAQVATGAVPEETSVARSIPLGRKPSGPETLGKSVFEMLFTELRNAQDGGSAKEAQQYTLQICGLLYSVSTAPLCRTHLSSPKWLRLLLRLVEAGSPATQQRVLQLLRRLLPFLHPSRGLQPTLDDDGDDAMMLDDSPTEAASSPAALVHFFLSVLASSLPASFAQHQLTGLAGHGDAHVPASSHGLVGEVVLLLRSLLVADGWQAILHDVVLRALSKQDATFAPASAGPPELLDQWSGWYRDQMLACAALCVLGGHVEGLQVGQTVQLTPRPSSSDAVFKGAKGVLVAIDVDKSTVDVLLHKGTELSGATTSAAAANRPVRIALEDIVQVPEVEWKDMDAQVVERLVVHHTPRFVDAILAIPDAPRAAEGDAAADAAVTMDTVRAAMTQEQQMLQALVGLHGMRAMTPWLAQPACPAWLVPTLPRLFQVATLPTSTSGLAELSLLEEQWLVLYRKWLEAHQRKFPAAADDTSDAGRASAGSATSASGPPAPPTAMCLQMMEMGFPREWCEVALAKCAYQVEVAINFCFEHSGDMDRLVAQATQKAKAPAPKREKAEPTIPPMLLEQLSEMGFPVNWCKKALLANRNNVDAALTWILSNGEALEAEDRRDEEKTTDAVVEPDHVAVRMGPNPLRHISGQASITDDLLVEGMAGGGFASVGAPDCIVSTGRWYYEATLLTSGCIQIGWADAAFCGASERGTGVGDGPHSWAYDGWRQQKWHGGSSPYGHKWKVGDVIGCGVDCDAGTIFFCLNGTYMGVAFRGVDFAGGLYPCASFNRRERLAFNFGGLPFRTSALDGVFSPMQRTLPPTYVKGSLEDSLEESVGDDQYTSDARYFGKDAKAALPGRHKPSAATTSLGADWLHLTRQLAILHARKALLAVLGAWPAEIPVPAVAPTAFVAFLKLVAPYAPSAVDDVGTSLDLLRPLVRHVVARHPDVAPAMLETIAAQVALAGTRKFAKVPWDATSDLAVVSALVHLGDAAWTDAEVVAAPNVYFAEWLTFVLLEDGGHDSRDALLQAWVCVLKSPSLCLKDKAAQLLARLLPDMPAVAMAAVPLDRLVAVCTHRLGKEYTQYPICSKYLQHMLELASTLAMACPVPTVPARDRLTRRMAAAVAVTDILRPHEPTTTAVETKAVADDDGDKQDESMADDDESMGDRTPPPPPPVDLVAIAHMHAEDKSERPAPPASASTRRFVPAFPLHLVSTQWLTPAHEATLQAAALGFKAPPALAWPHGFDIGVVSDDARATLWSGTTTQLKVEGPADVAVDEEDAPVVPPLGVGCKVKRGPHWKWRDQDGGDGSIGTVEGISPWSGVEGEGMSVRWANDALYTYRWGADGNYDLLHVEVDENNTIVRTYPTPTPSTTPGRVSATDILLHPFSVDLHFGQVLRVWPAPDGGGRVDGVIEWPDYQAVVAVTGLHAHNTLQLQEIGLLQGEMDMGWGLRFGCERWLPGTTYSLVVDAHTCWGDAVHHAWHEDAWRVVKSQVRLQSQLLFSLDPHAANSALQVSADGQSVHCTGGDARNLVLGTVGFSSGVHYWEVRVDQAEFGSVFIGVCEKQTKGTTVVNLNRWQGWGFVNFRATYHNSTERIYGDHFNAGDTIGVCLNMEAGKLSFFMDGIKYGEHIVTDLGTAFDGLKHENQSPKTLFPCIGLRKPGDKVTLNGKWVSTPGVPPALLCHTAMSFSALVHALATAAPLPPSFVDAGWRQYQRWHAHSMTRVLARGRVSVDLDTSLVRCQQVCEAAPMAFVAGDRVRILSKGGRALDSPEDAVVLGVYRDRLWYRVETQGNEGSEEGRSYAWYWDAAELPELILVKRNGVDVTAAGASVPAPSPAPFVPAQADEAHALASRAGFEALAAASGHALASDMALVEQLNGLCATYGVDALNLTWAHVQGAALPAPWSATVSPASVRARLALLLAFQQLVLHASPLVCFADDSRTRRDVLSVRRLVCTSTKLVVWDAILRATTTPTPLPSDEYEDPREIRVLRINRIQAQASKLALCPAPSDRLRKSVFGQLYREMRTWTDSGFRRAYIGKGHGGQKRAFKVKFLGEGVNDYGGPYRAVFEQIVDELQMDQVEVTKGEQGLLPLLVPCPNRRAGTGANQDKFVLNPSCGTISVAVGPIALELHRFLGKLIGMAVRHGLQMGLDVPSVVWRPLVGLPLSVAHLREIDVVAANTLQKMETDGALVQDGQLRFTTPLSDGTEVPLCPDGEHRVVDEASRAEYIEATVRTRLHESAPQVQALREGLASVLPMELTGLFTARELEVLICGRREVDVHLLEQCTEYEDVDPASPHIQYFWQVLHGLSSEDRTLFLRFVWARSRMPNSAKEFPMNFKIQAPHDQGARQTPDQYLPHAQTCFFSLSLPAYSSKEILEAKLLYAIQNSPNMDADVRLHNAEGWADA